MREFVTYWGKCAKVAAKGSAAFANDWQWLFGIPAVTGITAYLAAQTGTAMSTGSPVLDGVLAAFGAFVVTWAVAFAVRLLQAPVVFDRDQNREIDRLKRLVGEARSTSFDVFIETIPESDADRSFSPYGEPLVRVGITNIEVDATREAYAVLEDMPKELGISPAAKLPALGSGGSVLKFTIPPSETVYVELIELGVPSFLSERPRESKEVRFAASSSHSDSMQRAFSKDAVLEVGRSYSGVVAVHAAGAVSRRLPFTVSLAADGTLSVKTEHTEKTKGEGRVHRQVHQS